MMPPRETLPPEVFREVDSACERFEAEWKAGTKPQIAGYLTDTQEPVRSALLRELLLLDIEYRQKAGEEPRAAEYTRHLLPTDRELLQHVFGESPTQASQILTETYTFEPGAASPKGDEVQPQKPQRQPAQEKRPSEDKASSEGVPLEKIISSLTECGLMSTAEVEKFIESLPAESRPTTGKELAESLYRRKKLTKFQVQAVYQGKTRGLVMGNYVVLDRLGKGGMGQVYKARHRVMERVVAIKVLPSEATKSEEAVKRFQREVKAMARLSHRNIVTSHDADEHKGMHFLVMEYVEGKDLALLVKERGPLSLRQAVECVLQAARGLDYAHQQGIVHRDVKPQNIILDHAGTIKILDMGLARIRVDMENETFASLASLTQTGQVMGTVDYMSPEQAIETRLADARSDIYSLGATLYYLLCGTPPYPGDTVAKRLMAHRLSPIPSLREGRPEIPETLDRLFQSLLAKHPSNRPSTMHDVAKALDAEFDRIAPEAPLSSVFRSDAAQTESTEESPLSFLTALTDTTRSLPGISTRASIRSSRWEWPWGRRWSSAQIGLAAAGLAMAAMILAFVLSTWWGSSPEGQLDVVLAHFPAHLELVDSEGVVRSSLECASEHIQLVAPPGQYSLRVAKAGFAPFTQ
jgi:serine/threonine protein kinase